MLFRPNIIPCSSKFIQWDTLLPLTGPDTAALVGPFDFEPITSANRVRQKVELTYWELLKEACFVLSISPASLGSTHKPLIPSLQVKSNKTRKSKKQKV